MTTASTNTVFDHTSDAGFRTWGNELMTMLITTLGLTQTTDTGQLAFPMTATTRPATTTAAGYYILKFNDTLQSTTPIFIKIEPGTGGTSTSPGLWVTVGTGSNGSGTLTGLSSRASCTVNAGPLSTVTNYTSRGCYNATQGVLWIDFKQNGAVANESMYSFMVIRSVDNTGAPTSAAIGFQAAAAAANTINGNSGMPFQWYNAATTTWLALGGGGAGWVANNWCAVPWGTSNSQLSTIVGTAGYVFPCWQYAPTASAPGTGITNAFAMANLTEVSLGSTVTVTILGSTSLTYICGQVPSTSIASINLGLTSYGVLRLWQ
jgi:hypothetical protein